MVKRLRLRSLHVWSCILGHCPLLHVRVRLLFCGLARWRWGWVWVATIRLVLRQTLQRSRLRAHRSTYPMFLTVECDR